MCLDRIEFSRLRPDDRAREIVAEARRWLGTPFVHGGRDRAGVDCVGLLVVVARALRIPHEDTLAYPRRPAAGFVLPSLVAAGLSEADEVGPGRVLVFRSSVSGFVYHVGIAAEHEGRRTVIHATEPPGRVVEVTFAGRLADSLDSVWSF